jgi:hypothetical protein
MATKIVHADGSEYCSRDEIVTIIFADGHQCAGYMPSLLQVLQNSLSALPTLSKATPKELQPHVLSRDTEQLNEIV